MLSFQNDLSILKIKSYFLQPNEFKFQYVTEEEVKSIILELNPRKAALGFCLPASILR